MQRKYDTMLSFAKDLTPDSSAFTAEDIVQDAVLLLLNRPGRWPTSDLESVRIAKRYIKNVARNRWRQHLRRRETSLDVDAPGEKRDPWTEASAVRFEVDFESALSQLTAAERDVATGRLRRGLGVKEISATRGCSVKTAKNSTDARDES